MAPISPIQVPGTVRPGGHYSQAVVHNGLVYVAGQLPVDLTTGKPILGPVEAQTKRVLQNMEQILRSAGSSLRQIVQVTAYITRLDDWDAINATYAAVMGDHRPARAIVPVPELHYGVALEVTCVASVSPAARKRRATAQRGGRGRSSATRRTAARVGGTKAKKATKASKARTKRAAAGSSRRR